MPDVEITTHEYLPAELHEPLWDMYFTAFTPLRKLAAQRHVMFRSEYDDLMYDDRVTKIVARDRRHPYTEANSAPVLGLAVVTNDLKALPLIEPEYFAAREPKLYEQGHVWYTAFVCTRRKPVAPRETFRLLIDRVAEPIRPVRGVCYMDYAKCNVDRDLPLSSNRLLALTDPNAEAVAVDYQAYWAYYPAGRPL